MSVAARGDTFAMLWKSPSRVHRSRWVYDLADDLAPRAEGSIRALLVILPTAAPPDEPARRENARRLKTLAPSLGKLVTVVVGDTLWQSLVRAILRTMTLPHGGSRFLVFADSVKAGIERLVESPGPVTPSFTELVADVRAMYGALDVAPPPLGDEAELPPPRGSAARLRSARPTSRVWDELDPARLGGKSR